MGIWILFIISLVVATILVNGAQRLFMKWLNISAMFGRPRTKVIAIIVIALLLTAICTQIFGIEIPTNTSGSTPPNTANIQPETELSGQTSEFVIVDNVLLKYNAADSTSITIPGNVTEIGESAFKDCTSLESVTIPNSVTKIGSQTFYGCASLKSVVLGKGITEISGWMFYGCTSLESITIPDNVTTIGTHVFEDCTSLKSIIIPDSVTVTSPFDGVAAFKNCTSLTSVSIGSGMTILQAGMFEGCSSLTDIIVPDSVTKIDAAVFFGCDSLPDETIQKITQISPFAFKENYN